MTYHQNYDLRSNNISFTKVVLRKFLVVLSILFNNMAKLALSVTSVANYLKENRKWQSKSRKERLQLLCKQFYKSNYNRHVKKVWLFYVNNKVEIEKLVAENEVCMFKLFLICTPFY